MRSKAFLKTGGTIVNIRGHSNPRNNKTNYISTIINNRSITTNESSGMNNTSSINNFNKNIYRIRKNYVKKKPYDSLNYVPLNTIGTIGTGQSTWYHTKTVSSIHKEKKQLLENEFGRGRGAGQEQK